MLNWTKISVIFSTHSQKHLCCSGFSGLTGSKQVHPATAAGAEVSHETLMLCCCCCLFWDEEDGNRFEFHPEVHLNVCPRPYYSAAVSLTPCSHVWFDESLPGSEKLLPNTVTMHSNSLPSIVTCCLSLLQTPTHCTEITQHWFAQSSDSRLDLIPYI